MLNSRSAQLLVVVLFLGILLTGTTYFGITAILDLSNDTGDSTPDSATPSIAALNAFDRSFFCDEELRALLKRIDYYLFRQIEDCGVLVGRDGYLFPIGADTPETSDYRYLEDYLGIAEYDDNTLAQMEKSIEQRRIAYANQGAEYLLAVIPNSQTVYADCLPGYLPASGGQTRLEQFCAYLTGQGSSLPLLNLTDSMIAAKNLGQLYNNTENSLNALGAYAVYAAIVDSLGITEDDKSFVPMSVDDINIFTHHTTGKALAKAAGIADFRKNRTLSLTNDTEMKYEIIENLSGMETTYIKPGYKDTVNTRKTLLLEVADEWDKIQLMPYFSNTLESVAYKSSTGFSRYAVEYQTPDYVVQVIHEDDLDSLLDTAIMLSYADGLNPGDDPFTTMTPVVYGIAQHADDRFCIIGRCEEGSVVSLAGEHILPVKTAVTGERFILEAVFTENAMSSMVTLRASAQAKADSAPNRFLLERADSAAESSLLVGSNSMLFRKGPEFGLSGDIYSPAQLNRVSARLEGEVAALKRLSGKDTHLVYTYIPEKNGIYGEALAEDQRSAGQHKRLRQLSEALSDYPSVTVLDLQADLRSVRTNGLLYPLTDSHLSPLGAYYAYSSLMTHLSTEDAVLRPIPLERFVQSECLIPGGDLLKEIGLESMDMTEKQIILTDTVNPIAAEENIPPETGLVQHDAVLMRNRDSTLPTALVMHDSYGSSLIPFICAHFSETYVLSVDDFNLQDALVSAVKPDYIFILLNEYNIPLN